MNRPRLFLSAVSGELRSARQVVAATVRTLGYDPVSQDDFSTGHGELRRWLRNQIDCCEGLIQLVGVAYGAEPPEVDPDYGRVSYTQFEFLYAGRTGKKTWVIVVGEQFPRDRPLEQLDLADEAGYQAKRRQLQQEYIARLKRENHLRHAANNTTELENIILRLRDELAALRQQWEEWLREDVAFKARTTGSLDALAQAAQDPDALPRRQLHRDYAKEVQQKYLYWRSHYVPLSARGALRPRETPGPRADGAERIPGDFLPRGFRVQDSRSRSNKSADQKSFDDVLTAVAEAGDAVLLGEPGAGKTTSLWRLMLDGAERTLADRGAQLPILVRLGAYDGRSEILELVRRGLAEAVIEQATLPAHRRLALALKDELARGQLALFFDGLNEIPRDASLPAVSRLAEFRRAHPGNGFLFTCREADYVHPLPVSKIFVQPLEDERIREFIESRLPRRAARLLDQLYRGENRPLRDLCRNPYMLELVVYLAGECGALPANRAQLFAEFVGALLRREHAVHAERWTLAGQGACETELQQLHVAWPPLAEWDAHPDRFGLERLDEEGERRAFLATAGWLVGQLGRLAYSLSASGKWGTQVPKEVALKILGETVPDSELDSLVGLAADASLLERTPDGIRFEHQLLQEYFTAVHLCSSWTAGSESEKWLAYEAWDETAFMLAGMMPAPERLIERLLPLDPFLAARCAGTRPDDLAEDMAARVVDTLEAVARDVYGPWRDEAIRALGASRLRQALPALEGLLEEDARYAPLVLTTLGELGRPEAVDVLLRWLDHDHSWIRKGAAEALGSLGDRRAIPALMERLRDESADAWWLPAALERLCLPSDAGELLDMLRKERSAESYAAARVLAELGVREAIPLLLERLSKTAQGSEIFAEALGRLRADEAIPALLLQMKDAGPNYRARGSAAEALIKMADLLTIPTLREWLRDESDGFRAEAACRALVRLRAGEAIPDLIPQLSWSHPARRRNAREAIVELRAREAVPALVRALDAANEYERPDLVAALVKVGARDAIPFLVERLRAEGAELPRGNVPETADSLGGALQELWDRSDVPELLEFLADDQPWTLRWAAARTLGELGAVAAAKPLIGRLRDEVDFVRAAAARSLGMLGAREAVPALLEQLPAEESWKRDCMAKALARLNAVEAVPLLVKLLPDERWQVHWDTVTALGLADPQRAFPFWILRLADQHDDFRTVESKVSTLPGVLETLQPLLGHPDVWMRYRIAPLHERLRRSAGRPRPDRTLAPPSARAALRTVDEMSRRALALLPGWDVAAVYGADALRRLNQPDAALSLLDGDGAGPEFTALRGIERARCLHDLGRTAEACELIGTLLIEAPYTIAAVARLFERAGDLPQAEVQYDRAIEVARPYGFHRHRAAFLIRRARFDEAEADCCRAEALEQSSSTHDVASYDAVQRRHPDSERQRGLLSLARGRFEEALSSFQRAGRREPHGLSGYDTALVLLALGRDPDGAWAIIDGKLLSMELREQVEAARADHDLLARASPGLPELAGLRERLDRTAARIGRMEDDERARYAGTGQE